MMRTPRWLLALLIVALLLVSAPPSALAAHARASLEQQGFSVTAASTYLLVVTPPTVSVPAGVQGFDLAGYVNIEHARHFAEVETRLKSLQEQGAIASYAALPSAYAFAISAPTAQAVAVLPRVGRLHASGGLSAVAAGDLVGAYQRQLNAAVALATHKQAQLTQAQAQRVETAPGAERQAMAPRAAAQFVAAADSTAPVFEVHLHQNLIQGYNLAVGTPVTLTIRAGDGRIKGTATASAGAGGNAELYASDVFGNPVYAAAGDLVEVEVQALTPLSIPVVNLQAVASAAAQQVAGFGPPNVSSTSYLTPPYLELRTSASRLITTTAAGSFAAESVPLSAGDLGALIYTNELGHKVQLTWSAPILTARGEYGPLGSSYRGPAYAGGAVAAANAPVTVTLTRPGSPLLTNFARSDDSGRFSLDLRDVYGNLVPILAGNTLQATDGLVSTALVVDSFTVVSNPNTDTVSGETTATVVTDTVGLPQTLSVWPMSMSAGADGKTVLAAGGSFNAANPYYWGADSASSPTVLNWGPGQQGHLRYFDLEGDAVFEMFRASSPNPVLSLRGSNSYVAGNQVYGYLSGACEYGTVALLDAANAVKDLDTVQACSQFDASFTDLYDNPLPILPGDSVVATFPGGRTTRVQAPPLAVTANPKTDRVEGSIAPALVTTVTNGAPQSLKIVYAPDSRNVQPDGAGAFSADFSGAANIQPGSAGYAEYTDADGNRVFSQWQAPFEKPVLYLRGDGSGYVAGNYVAAALQGTSCSSERGLDLAVKTEGGAVRWQKTMPVCGSSVYEYLEDDFGGEVDLNPGDVVEATFAGQVASATVPRFDVVSDAKAATVSGLTNAAVVTTTPGATQTLAVWPDGASSYGKQVLVAAGGVFSATNPFYANADPLQGISSLRWDPGDGGYLRYLDAAGNHVYAPFAALVEQPLLRIHKDSNALEGFAPLGSELVTITIRSGATVKGAGYGAANRVTGAFAMAIYDGAGNPVEIAAGDDIVFSQPPAAVAVPPLSVYADLDQESISGQGPANAAVEVVVDGAGHTVVTDANGSYRLDLRGVMDLLPGDYLIANYRDAAGHLIWIDGYAGTMVAAALNSNRVWGNGPREQTLINVTVRRGGVVIGSASLTDSGEFTAFPIDAAGSPVVLAAGDVVELDFGAGVVKSLTLAALSLAVNTQADVLSGSGPANSLVGVNAAASPQPYGGSTATDGAGLWAVDLAATLQNMQPGATASVRYAANSVDATWLYGIAPYFTAGSGTEEVYGYAAPHAPVTVTLRRSGAMFAAAFDTAGEDGGYWVYLRDVNGLPVSIQAGDVIEVTSGVTMSVTVPVMTLTVDARGRTVSGAGPANALLGVLTSAGNQSVRTDGGGVFSASFATQTNSDLRWAELRYREPQGNWIHAGWTQETGGAVYLMARRRDFSYAANAVSGSTGAGPRAVMLTLKRGGQVQAQAWTLADRQGSFTALFNNSSGAAVDILAADVIEMAAGDVSKAMTVPALTVQANTDSDTLFGAGPPNATVQSNWCGSTTVDPSGAWVIKCSQIYRSNTGYVYVTDLGGNRTYLVWSAQGIEVFLNDNHVAGTLPPGGDVVLVQLLRRGAVIVEATKEIEKAIGYFYIEFFGDGGSPVIIQPGDVVVVNAGTPITIPVVELSAVAGLSTGKVTGSGPANQELLISAASSGFGLVSRQVTTGADGAYTADFSGSGSLKAGSSIDVSYSDAAGNTIVLIGHAPLLRINLSSDIVDGYTAAYTIATLALRRSGAVAATAQAATSRDGRFSVFFLDDLGNLIDLVADDEVEVTPSPASAMAGLAQTAATTDRAATAAMALTAALDLDADQVTGSAPPGSVVLVNASYCSLSNCDTEQLSAIANDKGVYTANFASFLVDLDATSYAYVQATDAAGNQTSVATEPAQSPVRQFAELQVLRDGATLVKSSNGIANAGNRTPPMPVPVSGGGRLFFQAFNGDLVITDPDGVVLQPDTERYPFTVEHAKTGVWMVQVDVSSGVFIVGGVQYAMAVGARQYSLYIPAIMR